MHKFRVDPFDSRIDDHLTTICQQHRLGCLNPRLQSNPPAIHSDAIGSEASTGFDGYVAPVRDNLAGATQHRDGTEDACCPRGMFALRDYQTPKILEPTARSARDGQTVINSNIPELRHGRGF